jgi:metal-responsive CopG/Arc/MetJ family transcriptional regulator
MTVTKSKVSLTISTDLLEVVDREAQRAGMTRSAVVEQYLRGGARRAAERSLDELTAAYYTSLVPDERAESEAIARASSRIAKTITYDAPVERRGRPRGRAQR